MFLRKKGKERYGLYEGGAEIRPIIPPKKRVISIYERKNLADLEERVPAGHGFLAKRVHPHRRSHGKGETANFFERKESSNTQKPKSGDPGGCVGQREIKTGPTRPATLQFTLERKGRKKTALSGKHRVKKIFGSTNDAR